MTHVSTDIAQLMARLLPRYTALSEQEKDESDKQARHAQARYDDILANDRDEKRMRRLREMGVSRGEYLDVEVKPSLATEKLRVTLQAIARNRRSESRGAVLLLHGANGAGKSFAACRWLLRARGVPWYATAHQLAAFEKEKYQNQAPEWRGDVYVLDQMGHERRVDRMSEFFTHVLRIGAVMVATTDLSANDFRARYPGHITDRLDEARPGLPYGCFVDCGAVSWRTGRGKEGSR